MVSASPMIVISMSSGLTPGIGAETTRSSSVSYMSTAKLHAGGGTKAPRAHKAVLEKPIHGVAKSHRVVDGFPANNAAHRVPPMVEGAGNGWGIAGLPPFTLAVYHSGR